MKQKEMKQKERVEVLVVGAGPCGLAAACLLRQQGVSVRILDSMAEPRSGSRAGLLWPPALDVLHAAGVLTTAERTGTPVWAMNYWLPGERVVRIRLEPPNQPLLLPQAQTEELLTGALHALGGKVEHSMRVTGVHVEADAVRVEAVGPAGTEQLEAGWLIGADGVGSTVRDQLGIEFAGQQIPGTLLLAEGRVDGDLGCGELNYHLGWSGGPKLAFLSLLSDGRLRFATPVPSGTTVTPVLVQRLLDERGPGNLRMRDLSFASTFTSQERLAARLRQGRCFLVGDAAHTHSPLGGRGLSLGLVDVLNLAWKLGGVSTGRLHPRILDTYEVERRHAAEETVRSNQRMVRVVMTARPSMVRVRNSLLRLLAATGVLQRVYPPVLAGQKHRYPLAIQGLRPPQARKYHDRALWMGAPPTGHDWWQGRGRGRGPAMPGARVPQWVPDPVAATGGMLRLVTIGPATGEVARCGAAVPGRFPGLVSHEHLTRGTPGFLLLRPDGYVAASGLTRADLDAVEPLLAGLLP